MQSVNAKDASTEFPKVSIYLQPVDAHHQAPESETAVLVGDRVFAVEAALVLSHCLHGYVPLCVPAQGLHCSVAAARNPFRYR